MQMSFASLPFELLVRICRLNAHRWQKCSQDFQEPLRDTIAASQVCSRWRFIVLSAPELWRFAIDPYHPCALWRDMVLKRSEPLSIEFIDASHASGIERTFGDVQLQMQSGMHQRLRRYDLSLDSQAETISSPHPLWPSDPGSWPQLQRLCLIFYPHSAGDPDSHPKGYLPVRFPGLATPILERLSLTLCCMPDWNELGAIGNTLTHLEIYHPPSRLCADRWIELVRNLPNLLSFELLFAVEAFCNHPSSSHPNSNHPNSNNRLTLGVKKFAFADRFHCCTSFLDRIDLSATKCRSSNISCLRHPQFDLEIPAEDAMQAVLPHIKRLLSQVVMNTSRFRISDSSIVIQSGFTEPAILSRNLGQTVIAEHSSHFYISFHRNRFWGSLLFTTLLDLIRPICTSVELAETSPDAWLESYDWDHFFDVLIHCQNLHFMQGVSLPWWKWLCKRLIPAIGEATNDAMQPLFPHLRSIAFQENIRIGEGPVKPTKTFTLVKEIPFDELKAFCKHRAKIRVPLEWISTHWNGIFRMDSFGEIKPEPEPRNTTRRAGSSSRELDKHGIKVV